MVYSSIMSTLSILDLFDHIISACRPAFAQPRTHKLWAALLIGWLLTVTHRTLTGMLVFTETTEPHAHDAYHRLLRVGAWSLSEVFHVLAQFMVALLPPEAMIPLAADDTLAHHVGPKVAGAGWYRDPVASTGTKTVSAPGLSLVILTLLIVPPWGGPPLALPLLMRVHVKSGTHTYVDLLEAMLREVCDWFPARRFTLVADGAYVSIANRVTELPVIVISRMRQDAHLFDLPTPNPPHKRGPKPQKGPPLPKPREMAADPATPWKYVQVRRKGKLVLRRVYTRQVIWHAVCPHHPLLLVIVRDPKGHEEDDFFLTTEVASPAQTVVNAYGDRWSIEVTIRDSKQVLGLEEPQCWREEGPARAAGLGLWLLSLVWIVYLTSAPETPVATTPWYPQKRVPSFADALATVRTELWLRKIGTSEFAAGPAAIIKQCIHFLARAA